MRAFMIGLSHLVRRNRWVVIAAWIALVAFSVPFSQKDNEHLSAGLSGIEGTQSQTVQNALDAGDFGAAGDPQAGIVLEPAAGATAAPQQLQAAVRRVQDAVRTTAQTAISSRSLQQAQQQAQLGRPFIMAVQIDTSQAASVSIVQDLIDALDAGSAKDGVTTYVVGQSSLQAEQIDESNGSADLASLVSIPVILILLLATLGALVAALLPLVFGFSAVVVTGMVIYFLSQSLTISIYATSLSAMIGLAVAVDYSLFILMRYREELRRGRDREGALATAMSTSTIAVMFSGTTVVISLLGLFLVPNATVRSMALGAVIVVAVALLGAATLLPALITVLRGRVEHAGPAGRALAHAEDAVHHHQPGTPTFWERQTARVTKRPWVTVLTTLALLLLVAYPFARISLNENSVLQLPSDNQARVGTEKAAQIAGPGATGPAVVMLSFDSGTLADASNRQALGEIADTLRGDRAVASVSDAVPSTDQRKAFYNVVLTSNPESDEAKDAVKRIRPQLDGSQAAQIAAIDVGGQTATEVDFRNSISSSMWKIVLFILVASFVVLLALLRSIVLPLVGVAMNVLCVGAAYGVLVAIFQWGWLPGLGLQDFGFVNSVILPLLLAVVFGLSMDYQVFLLTRVRERVGAGESTADAARQGTAIAGHTIAAAATIMIGVFVVFVIFGVPTIQAAGLGAAVAVAFSAMLVQLAFMPSLMILLGERTWWLPGWLDRMLPRIELE